MKAALLSSTGLTSVVLVALFLVSSATAASQHHGSIRGHARHLHQGNFPPPTLEDVEAFNATKTAVVLQTASVMASSSTDDSEDFPKSFFAADMKGELKTRAMPFINNPHQRIYSNDQTAVQPDASKRKWRMSKNALDIHKLTIASAGLAVRQTSLAEIYAAPPGLTVPKIASSTLHGPSSDDPSTQYIDMPNPPLASLTASLLYKGVNGDLTTDYGLALNTGNLIVDSTTKNHLKDLKYQPHMSRDGGKGGYLNGSKLFVFCDTGSYSPPSGGQEGNFLGFTSSSVATDKGSNGVNGMSLVLQDNIGEWSDDAGRMRGMVPLTAGEEGYNLVMQGGGQRYAVWPESSIIPLNQTHGLLYAPIIYDDVNRTTGNTTFTYTGTTLLALSVPGEGGPIAERLVNKLFKQQEVEWGTIGGVRSYGASGVGGNDGKIYIFGNVHGGLLVARVDVGKITDRNSYEYWTMGGEWSSRMQASSSTAYVIAGGFMDGDVFYSPHHKTFLFIYLNPYADNKFYYRYLQSDHAIIPSYSDGNGEEDYVENIVKHTWSDEQVLFEAPMPKNGHYIYAGGVHMGYFEGDEVTNGGTRMLISWSAPTGENPASSDSEYQLCTAEINWV
ncbi:hypothetical protein LTR16_002288 [Cryomyces antarcticus]|uniref:Uncharacterized protein n=1 Tax=Cryomyces antarcticus TaxID=329879 RepID=A0ABR0LR05_9PEZI|nr:hypothetical protein LTR16_002288 [Cryomyces antarcticus]